MKKLFLLGAALVFVQLGCSSRNIYKSFKAKGTPPIERGYVYMTRDQLLEAGHEPAESGSPFATKDTVFIASENNGLEAMERSNFRRKWQFKPKNGLSSEIAVDNGIVYFGANDGAVYAVDAEFGKQLWRYETKAPVFARPNVSGGKVYVATSDDIVYCLEKESGRWLWHYKRGGSYITTVHGNSAPAVDLGPGGSGLVYAGFSDGYLAALSAQDGNLKWEQKIHRGAKFTDVDAMPLVDGNRIYVPSYDGELYALDKTKGTIFWHIELGGSKKVVVDDKMLFVAASNGTVSGVNKETGRIAWRFNLDDGTPTNLVQRGNYLAFGGSRQFFYVIYKGDGNLAYRFNAGLRSGFFSSPAQLDQDIYILSNFGNLYVFKWNVAAR